MISVRARARVSFARRGDYLNHATLRDGYNMPERRFDLTDDLIIWCLLAKRKEEIRKIRALAEGRLLSVQLPVYRIGFRQGVWVDVRLTPNENVLVARLTWKNNDDHEREHDDYLQLTLDQFERAHVCLFGRDDSNINNEDGNDDQSFDSDSDFGALR